MCLRITCSHSVAVKGSPSLKLSRYGAQSAKDEQPGPWWVFMKGRRRRPEVAVAMFNTG